MAGAAENSTTNSSRKRDSVVCPGEAGELLVKDIVFFCSACKSLRVWYCMSNLAGW